MNTQPTAEIDLQHFARMLRHHIWLLAAITLSLAALVFAYSTTRPNMYRAAAEVRVISDMSMNLFGNASRSTGGQEMANALYLIESASVRTEVNAALGSDRLLVSDVSTEEITGTDIVRVTVTSRDAEVAAAAANAYAETYVSLRRSAISRAFLDQATELRNAASQLNKNIAEIDARLVTQPDAAESDVLQAQRTGFVQQQNNFIQRATEFEIEASLRSENIQVVQPAMVPREPFAPTPVRNAAIGGVLGFLLAMVVVFLLDWLDNKVRSPADIEAITGAPAIGIIPLENGNGWLGRRKAFGRKNPHLLDLSSAGNEAYRSLQTSLRFSTLGKQKHRIAVTSSIGSEGKTTACANLARILAESGMRVTVISGDLRRPMIGKVLGVGESGLGLSSVLVGDAPLSDCLVQIDLDAGRSIDLLPAGPLIQNPVALLSSPQFGELLTRIEDAGVDFILIDCAPVLPVSDTLAITEHVDGVVVMSVAGRTRKGSLNETVNRLRKVGAEVIGVVLNGVPTTRGYGGYGYGAYGYGAYGSYQSDPDRVQPTTTPTTAAPSAHDAESPPPSRVPASAGAPPDDDRGT